MRTIVIFLTYIGLIFECVPTSRPPTVKVRGPLTGELTILGRAILGGPKSLKALLYDSRVFAMIICVHLHVRCRYVYLVAILVDAVIMGLLSVVRAGSAGMLLRAIVGRRVSHEAMLQGFVPLLVPLEVPDHFLLFHEYSTAAVQTMKVLPTTQFLAICTAAFLTGYVSLHISRVIDDRLGDRCFGTAHQRIRYR